MTLYVTTFGAPVRARVETRRGEYPEAPRADLLALHKARSDMESLRDFDPAWHARARLILRSEGRYETPFAEAVRIRRAIEHAKAMDDEPRERTIPPCGRCGRGFDCTCGT